LSYHSAGKLWHIGRLWPDRNAFLGAGERGGPKQAGGDEGGVMTRRFYDLVALAQTQGVRRALKTGLEREEGQDGIEYALVAAVVVVAVIAAMKAGFPGTIISTAIGKVSGALG
jgi:hypothetical protein